MSNKWVVYTTWNDRGGFIDNENEASDRVLEIEQYMNKYNVNLFVINEADLHGPLSTIQSIKKQTFRWRHTKVGSSHQSVWTLTPWPMEQAQPCQDYSIHE